MSGEVSYVVADLDQPQPEQFAVLAVHLDRPVEGGGLMCTVVSLHMTREEADRVIRSPGSISEAPQ